jgi:hypothetical protein
MPWNTAAATSTSPWQPIGLIRPSLAGPLNQRGSNSLEQLMATLNNSVNEQARTARRAHTAGGATARRARQNNTSERLLVIKLLIISLNRARSCHTRATRARLAQFGAGAVGHRIGQSPLSVTRGMQVDQRRTCGRSCAPCVPAADVRREHPARSAPIGRTAKCRDG